MPFEPRIVGILCHWCSYSAADGAARAKRALPAGLRTLRVLCTGRVEPGLIVRALQGGADGVLVCGCHPGDCHYVSGNCKALGRFTLLERLVAAVGLEPGRLRLAWISAQEEEAYARITAEMTETVRALGPLRWPAPAPAPVARPTAANRDAAAGPPPEGTP